MHDTGKLHPTFLTILHPKSLKEINMELTIIETSAYLELKRQLSTLSVQMEDLVRKMNGCAGGMPGVGNLEKVSPGLP